MNLDEMTIGQFKEFSSLFNMDKKTTNIANHLIGKYVIIRSRNEGLNAGVLSAIDETGCILKEARRLWYHKPAKEGSSWYEGCTNHGLDSSSKVSEPVPEKVIIEDFSIITCSDVAQKSIVGMKSHED